MIFHRRKCRKDYHAEISGLWLTKMKGSHAADEAWIFHFPLGLGF